MQTTFQKQMDAIQSSMLGLDFDSERRKVLNDAIGSIFYLKHITPKCEFCEGAGEYSRDNSDGVAVEGTCTYCNGSGIERSQLTSEGITATEIKNQFPSNDVIITVEKLYTEE